MINLKYTNQDYAAILDELINSVKNGQTGLTSAWNNMSQADPLFLLMHLFAAHKDMENFMIDYRLNESFMSTARERASMVRVARSYGYKIPSYRTGSAEYAISAVPSATMDDFIIPNWSSFIDTLSNRSFVYISDNNADYYGDLTSGIGSLDHIRLFEGAKQTHAFSPSAIEKETRTHVISNQAISIGTSYSPTKMVSRLLRGSTLFTEVPNLLEYVGTNLYVYELDVDPQGITYIRFHQNLDLDESQESFELTYLISGGSSAVFSQSITTTEAYEVTLEGNISLNVVASLVTDTVSIGIDPAIDSEIKYGFANYIAVGGTFTKLMDIYNYILNEQTINTNIAKVAVFNNREDAIRGTLDVANTPENLYQFEVCIVLMNALNQVITDSNLLEDIQNRVALPTELFLNGRVNGVNYELQFDSVIVQTGKEHLDVGITFPSSVSLTSSTFTNRLRATVKSYLDSINVGWPATDVGLKAAFRNAGFSPDVYGDATSIVYRETGSILGPVSTYYPKINRVVNIDTADLLTNIYLSNA